MDRKRMEYVTEQKDLGIVSELVKIIGKTVQWRPVSKTIVYSDNAWLQTSVQKFKNYNEVQLSGAQLAQQSIPETVRVHFQHFWCQPYLAVNLGGGA